MIQLKHLPYELGALEPVVSGQTMEFHYGKHHRAYVNNLNTLNQQSAEALATGNIKQYIDLAHAVKFNGGGHLNHEFFWDTLQPPKEGGGVIPDEASHVRLAIEREWGTLQNFMADFNKQTISVQGSGSLMTYAEEWKMLPHSLVYSSTSDMMSGDGGGIVLAATARSGLIDQERALNVLKMERLAPTDEKKFLERNYPARGSGSFLETDTAPSLDDDEEYNSMTNDIADRVQEQGISKALEQAMADSCVGRLAQDMGKAEDAAFFTKRSQTVRKYWSKEQHLYEKFDLADLDEENRQEADFTEGTPLQYSFAGQFDVDWQIKARGGREKFACDLKNFFEKAPEPSGQPDVAGNFHGASMGNEPCMHTPYLFSLLGYPQETQRVVDKVVKTAYSDTPGGIPGNDDMGEMSSWLVFSDLGFYPADPCSGGLALGRPFVDHAILTVKGGSLELVVQNQSEDNAYIQQAHWRGKLLEKPVIPFSELEAGGKLELVMGSKPVQASLKC